MSSNCVSARSYLSEKIRLFLLLPLLPLFCCKRHMVSAAIFVRLIFCWSDTAEMAFIVSHSCYSFTILRHVLLTHLQLAANFAATAVADTAASASNKCICIISFGSCSSYPRYHVCTPSDARSDAVLSYHVRHVLMYKLLHVLLMSQAPKCCSAG